MTGDYKRGSRAKKKKLLGLGILSPSNLKINEFGPLIP
jgi:hypothetical protein